MKYAQRLDILYLYLWPIRSLQNLFVWTHSSTLRRTLMMNWILVFNQETPRRKDQKNLSRFILTIYLYRCRNIYEIVLHFCLLSAFILILCLEMFAHLYQKRQTLKPLHKKCVGSLCKRLISANCCIFKGAQLIKNKDGHRVKVVFYMLYTLDLSKSKL